MLSALWTATKNKIRTTIGVSNTDADTAEVQHCSDMREKENTGDDPPDIDIPMVSFRAIKNSQPLRPIHPKLTKELNVLLSNA